MKIICFPDFVSCSFRPRIIYLVLVIFGFNDKMRLAMSKRSFLNALSGKPSRGESYPKNRRHAHACQAREYAREMHCGAQPLGSPSFFGILRPLYLRVSAFQGESYGFRKQEGKRKSSDQREV